MKKKLNIILNCLLFFSFSNFILSACSAQHQDDVNQHLVICSYEQHPKNQETLDDWNEIAHIATYEIKQYIKNKYNEPIHENKYFSRHKDSVFFIHFDYDLGFWTLYKPSFINYDDFVAIAKKIYNKYELKIIFQKEESIKILSHYPGFDGEYISLQELEKYKNMTPQEFDRQIQILEKKSSKENNLSADIEKLKKIKKMSEFFFWHLQIPTTGLLPSDKFNNLDNQHKPLAWNFLLWDLAPKKGAGAKVAIIDTGISGFKLKDPKLSSEYKKNINIFTPCNLQNYGYNLVSENGLDPIRQIAINFGHYCDHKKFDMNHAMKELPKWIKDFIQNKNSFQLEQYFIKNSKITSLQEDGASLNERGKNLLNDLLYGRYGIAPKNEQPFFTVINLDHPYNQKTLLETLPAPKIIGNENAFAAGHGTFTQGIVHGNQYKNQGITGLAPHADVVMIKAFHDNGTTNKTTLNGALERAIALKSSIVSMSLKITDTISETQDALLKKLIDSIDYVVAASGNDGDDPMLHNKEAYPAKFSSVAFDVGAFKYDNGNYSVCSFTQKEPNIGPKFIAPGFDLFSSCTTPHQTDDSMYAFMAGTSVAVPVVTGFLALTLAEFQDVLSKEEILKVIYTFSIKLNNDDDWQKGSILGTIDMRSALLCLHVLKSIKVQLHKQPELKYSYTENFDKLVQAIYTMNYYLPISYEKELGYSFTQDFAHYAMAAQTQKNSSIIKKINYWTPFKSKSTQSNIKSVINFMTGTILSAIISSTLPVTTSPKHTFKNIIDEKLYKQLQEILSAQKYNLFEQLTEPFQNRIHDAIMSRKSTFS